MHIQIHATPPLTTHGGPTRNSKSTVAPCPSGSTECSSLNSLEVHSMTSDKRNVSNLWLGIDQLRNGNSVCKSRVLSFYFWVRVLHVLLWRRRSGHSPWISWSSAAGRSQPSDLSKSVFSTPLSSIHLITSVIRIPMSRFRTHSTYHSVYAVHVPAIYWTRTRMSAENDRTLNLHTSNDTEAHNMVAQKKTYYQTSCRKPFT